MPKHLYKYTITIKTINIAVRFPCSVCFALKNQINITQSLGRHHLINNQANPEDKITTNIHLQYSEETQQYKDMEVLLTIMMISTSGKITAGNVVIQIAKNGKLLISTNNRKIGNLQKQYKINKCPDKMAKILLHSSIQFVPVKFSLKNNQGRSEEKIVKPTDDQDFHYRKIKNMSNLISPYHYQYDRSLGTSKRQSQNSYRPNKHFKVNQISAIEQKNSINQGSQETIYHKLSECSEESSLAGRENIKEVQSINREFYLQFQPNVNEDEIATYSLHNSKQNSIHQKGYLTSRRQGKYNEHLRNNSQGVKSFKPNANQLQPKNGISLYNKNNVNGLSIQNLKIPDSKLSEQHTKRRQLQQKIDNLVSNVQKYQKKIDSLQIMCSQKEQLYQMREEDIRHLSQRINKLEDSISDYQIHLNAAQKSILLKDQNYKEQISKFIHKNQQIQEQKHSILRQLNQNLQETQIKQKQWQQRLKDKQSYFLEEKNKMAKRVEQLKDELNYKQQRNQEFIQQIGLLKNNLNFATCEKNHLMEEMLELNEHIQEVNTKYTQQRILLQKKELQLIDYRKTGDKLRTLQRSHQGLQQQLIHTKQLLLNNRISMDKLSTQLKDKEHIITGLNNQNGQFNLRLTKQGKLLKNQKELTQKQLIHIGQLESEVSKLNLKKQHEKSKLDNQKRILAQKLQKSDMQLYRVLKQQKQSITFFTQFSHDHDDIKSNHNGLQKQLIQQKMKTMQLGRQLQSLSEQYKSQQQKQKQSNEELEKITVKNQSLQIRQSQLSQQLKQSRQKNEILIKELYEYQRSLSQHQQKQRLQNENHKQFVQQQLDKIDSSSYELKIKSQIIDKLETQLEQIKIGNKGREQQLRRYQQWLKIQEEEQAQLKNEINRLTTILLESEKISRIANSEMLTKQSEFEKKIRNYENQLNTLNVQLQNIRKTEEHNFSSLRIYLNTLSKISSDPLNRQNKNNMNYKIEFSNIEITILAQQIYKKLQEQRYFYLNQFNNHEESIKFIQQQSRHIRDQKQQQINAISNQLGTIKEQYKNNCSSNAAQRQLLLQQIRDIQQNYQNSNIQQQRLQKQLISIRIQLEEFQVKNKQLNEQNKNLYREIQSLKKSSQLQQEKMSHKLSSINQKQHQILKEQSQIDNGNNFNDKHEVSNANRYLQSTIQNNLTNEFRQRCRQLENNLQKYEQKLQQAYSQINRLEHNNNKLKETLSDISQNNSRLNVKIQTAQLAYNSKLEIIIETKSQEIFAINQELQKSKMKQKLLQKQNNQGLKDLRQQKQIIYNKYEQLKQVNHSLKQQLQKYQQKLPNVQRTNKQLLGELDQLKRLEIKWQSKLDLVNIQLAQKRDQFEQLNKSYHQQKELLELKKQEAIQMKQKIQNLNQQLINLQTQFVNLQKEHKSIHSSGNELKLMKAKHNQQRNKIISLESRVKNQEKQTSKIKQQKNQLEQKIQQIVFQHKCFVNTYKEEIAKNINTLDDSRKKYRYLQKQYQKIKYEMQSDRQQLSWKMHQKVSELMNLLDNQKNNADIVRNQFQVYKQSAEQQIEMLKIQIHQKYKNNSGIITRTKNINGKQKLSAKIPCQSSNVKTNLKTDCYEENKNSGSTVVKKIIRKNISTEGDEIFDRFHFSMSKRTGYRDEQIQKKSQM